MFDLILGNTTHIPHKTAGPILVSMGVQLTIVATMVVVPLLYFTDQLPVPSTMMAFVAAAPAPPPPPPPPPPPVRAAAPETPVPTSGAAAPIDEPTSIQPEVLGGAEEGVPGGVVGGVPGGVIAGIVGGLEVAPPPPPPPPPPRPVRAGGDIKTPALLRRVEPVYPALAVAANIEATVILDAIVDEEGNVTEVSVLRSGGVLDKAAIEAVKQWRYAPLLLNGRPAPFQLTVVLSFRLQR